MFSCWDFSLNGSECVELLEKAGFGWKVWRLTLSLYLALKFVDLCFLMSWNCPLGIEVLSKQADLWAPLQVS